ncbi:hypothetical protein AX774_g5719 [Zancudomyces culisetae]|uniref:Uncharacterized protein n=1 Tax=Zancudomyces culisetae TaxID=1213189 RepID=A0A1R1PIJ7_ZANCU|nr:hypothetical protein AX774_g5719 [Zancudomyces culisetae]|eukprot:OMH80835.1 hypothetical protein AX774_g5719 [Zancudomyces culisetae]
MSNGYIEPIALPLNSTADVLDEADVDMNTNDDKHNFFMNHSDDTRNTSLHGNNPEYLNNNEMDISPAVQRLVQPSLSIGVKSGSINGNPSLSSLPNSMELSIQKVSDRSDEIVQLLKEQNSLLRKNVLQSEQMAQKVSVYTPIYLLFLF